MLADDLYTGHLPTIQTKSVTVLADTIPPQVTITQPAADALFFEGPGQTITVRATITDAEMIVKDASVRIAGTTTALARVGTTNDFTATIPVPLVDGTAIVTRDLEILATDYAGNTQSPAPSVAIRIQPVDDANNPTVAWDCPTSGALIPPGYSQKLRLHALGNTAGVTANAIQKLELVVDGSTLLALPVNGSPDTFEVPWISPQATGVKHINAIATNYAGHTAEAAIDLEVVQGTVFTTNTTIGATELATENQTVIVQSGTLTIEGKHHFARLAVLDGAKVTHIASDATTIHSFELDVAGDVYIACNASIDVSGRGFSGTRTWTDATPSSPNAGGSHGGRGGRFDAANESGSTYGSLFDPNSPGAAGANGGVGGGVVRINATNVTLDGNVLANGTVTNNNAGAGGSVLLRATGTIRGNGQIHADGASATAGAGGGRIALYSNALTLNRNLITAKGGLVANDTNRSGAAGTLFLKQTAQANGALVVDNGATVTTRPTTLSGVGFAEATSTGAAFVTDSAAKFLAPDQLRGIRLVVNGNRTITWPIVANDATKLTLDVTASALGAQSGDILRGLYRFDAITLRNATLDSTDFIETLTAADVDAVSTVINANDGAPRIDRTKVTLQTTAGGYSVSGSAGAVSDPDTPVTLTARNEQTTLQFTKTPNADGSFIIAVQGNQGDSITLRARDAGRFPAETRPYVVGTLDSGTAAPTQLQKTDWTADTSFKPRTIARDGKFMVLTSGSGSNTIVILDVSDPARPALVRAFDPGANTVRDAAISNGWAFLAANRLAAIDLNNLSTQPTTPPTLGPNFGGDESAIVAADGYVFSAESNSSSGGMIRIYDVSSPANLRHLRDTALYSGQGIDFTGLALYGSEYLIAMTPAKDVVVIDRRDVTNLNVVGSLEIAGFSAYRGRVAGKQLYVSNRTQTEFAIFDLSNPKVPALLSRTVVPQTTSGIAVVGNDAFIATNNAAVTTVDVSNPTAPAINGSITVNGIVWDVDVFSNYLYVANETGLAVVRVNVAPQIAVNRITLGLSGVAATITGATQSVSGAAPLRVDVKNETTGATVTNVSVAANGSFTATFAASPDDRVTIIARDSANRSAGPADVGRVPFGSAVTALPITAQTVDATFRARRVEVEGDLLAVHGYPYDNGGNSDDLVVYDISTPSQPVSRGRIATNLGNLWDIAIQDGWAYLASNSLGAVDLRNTTPVVYNGPNFGGEERAVVVDGPYAFTAEAFSSSGGTIRIYDISTPSQPRHLRDQSIYSGQGFDFTDLVLYGTDYIVGITGGGSFDVTVIDRRDLSNLKTLGFGKASIPNFSGFRGVVQGTTLWVAGNDGGIAAVDLSNPRAASLPFVVYDTPGIARAADAAGATVVVADGGSVAFIDPARGLIGAQAVGGTVWDIALHRGMIYVANEQGLTVIRDAATPPAIDARLITLTTDRATMATATGAANAISGLAPMKYALTDATTGASIADVAVHADGGFTSTLPAAPGDRMTLTVTDAAGRITGPFNLGLVPFGAPAQSIPTQPSQADSDFRARTLALAGNTLAVASYPVASNGGGSARVLLYDVSTPATPVYLRTVNMNNSPLRDLAIVDHYLYGTGNTFAMVDLNDPNATVATSVTNFGGTERAIAVAGGYAYVAEADSSSGGTIRIYDVSTPAAPRYLRDQSIYSGQGIDFTDVLTLGSDYLVAIGPARDVTVIDRRDVNNLVFVKEVPIANFESFRGHIDGTTLYLAGLDGGLAVIDLTVPSSPVVRVVDTQGVSTAADVAGSIVAVADNLTGISFVDVSGAAPRIAGTQTIAGNAWDVVMHRSALYVAAETGIAVIADLATPPTVKTSLVTITTDGAGKATMSGAAQSVAGLGPLSVSVRNAPAATSQAGSVAANGSFSVVIDAEPGQLLTLTATDGAGRVAGPLVIGQVPFGDAAASISFPLATVANDANFRARSVAAEGKWLAVASHQQPNGSDKVVLYDVTNPAAPQYTRTLTTGAGELRDIAISGGWLYVTGNRLNITKLDDPTKTASGANFGGTERAIAVAGGFAYVAEADSSSGGSVRIYDVADPMNVRDLRFQSFYSGQGFDFTDLLLMGQQYLIALTPASGEYDVTVIDRRDVNNLTFVRRIQIPQIAAFRGKVVGTTLYVAGADGGLAVVDLSNVDAPTYQVYNTQGVARGVDVAGSLAVVADGSTGLTFVDSSDLAHLALAGSQNVGGTAWDVVLHRGVIYAANEQGLAFVANAAVPPMIDEKNIVLTTDGSTTATIAAGASAVSGLAPLTVVARNTVTNAVSSTQTIVNGAFTATVAAVPGQRLELKATDRHGRVSIRSLGQVPFANLVHSELATYVQALNDASFRARRVTTDGTRTIVSTGSTFAGVPRADKILVYQQTSPTATPSLLAVNTASGGIDQVVLKGDYAYTASNQIAAINLGASPVTITYGTNFGGRENSIAVIGNRLYAAEAESSSGGMVSVYDVTAPASPVSVARPAFYSGQGIDFSELVPYGTDYLIALSAARDVSILDIRNTNAIGLTRTFAIDNFDSLNGAVQGTTLYVAGGSKGIAIIDISNPATPVLQSIVQTPGLARAVAISGTNEIVVADAGGPGLTFIDTSNKQQPVILGSQPLPGNPTDVKAIGKTLYVAGETFFHIVNRP